MKVTEADSYQNVCEADVPLGGSAHSLRNQLVGSPRQQHVLTKPGLYVPWTEHTTAPPPYDYSSSHGIYQASPLPSPHRGMTKGSGPTVLANDEKYPLMLPSSQTSPLPARTKSSGLPRYGSPTFPPSATRDSDLQAPLSSATSGAVRRPVSFVRALEASDQLVSTSSGRSRPPRAGGLQATAEDEERVYGSSYEIAV